MEVMPPSNPAAANHPTTDLHQPPRSLSRGGCHNRWHSLANCDHRDSINQVGGGAPCHAMRPAHCCSCDGNHGPLSVPPTRARRHHALVPVRVRVKIMGLLMIRPDRDFPTTLQFRDPIISTRTRNT
eukprot:COSAG01_NODE_13232_length_1616_cov_2.297297_1_plen_127_part_00